MTTPIALLPAIDLMDGRCVRLSQGKADERTDYSDDPVAIAQGFEAEGTQWIHLVDLDGAFEGVSKNWETIASIREAVGVKLEIGGGMRNAKAVQRAVDAGIDRIVIGTWAANDSEAVAKEIKKHGDKIAIDLAAKDGKVALRGWTEVTDMTAVTFAKHWGEQGIASIVATDVATDGMLTGPNIEFLRELALEVPEVGLIASGGISGPGDLTALKALDLPNLIGVITGRALYTGHLTVKEGLAALG